MPKLTLSVDDRVKFGAKRYAKRGLAPSQIVEANLEAVAEPATPPRRDAPLLRSLRGSLARADLTGYGKHLAAKYR